MKTYCKCNLWLKVQLGSFMVDYPYHILVCQEYAETRYADVGQCFRATYIFNLPR